MEAALTLQSASIHLNCEVCGNGPDRPHQHGHGDKWRPHFGFDTAAGARSALFLQ